MQAHTLFNILNSTSIMGTMNTFDSTGC